ncbi:MAG TPA: hypothetical protein VJQ54_06795 [Candidatus Sulfotelmatobacter sp.]|nr:hypothetical protein [Candidatus Sulfotelmatobacter sp.]
MPANSGLLPFHIAIQQPWFVIQSRTRRAIISLAVAFLVFICGGVLDWFVTREYLPRISLMLGGAAIAVAIGVLAFQILTDIQERYLNMLDRLRRIAELNHHVRNALQVIAYHNELEHVGPAKTTLRIEIERIESALRQISAALGDRPSSSRQPDQR